MNYPSVVQGEPRNGRFTGEVLLHTRPKTYRKAVELLSQGRSANSIAKELRVSRMTLAAIQMRQAEGIAQRKKEIVNILTDVSHVGAARMADTIGKAKLREASIGTGIAIDKALALLGQTPATAQVAVILPSQEDRDTMRQLDAKLDAFARRLQAPRDSTVPPAGA